MKKISLPSAQTILLIITVFTAGLTWIIPAGKFQTLSYDKEVNQFTISDGQEKLNKPADQNTLNELGISIGLEKFTSGDIYKPINIPNTYKQTEANPQGWTAIIKAPIKGIIETADIIFLVLIIGGLIELMNISGAFGAGIQSLSKALVGKESILIIITTSLFALGGTTFGMAEETLAFYPILIPVFLAARYDALVGTACIFMGSALGTMCSTVNPFSVVIASDAAGINWTTGLYGRLILLIILLIVCILYIKRYGKRVQNDPSSSLIANLNDQITETFKITEVKDQTTLSWRHKIILIVFSLSFIIMVIGVAKLGWWFVEMSTIFFVASIIIGFIAKIPESKFIDAFVKGASSLLGVAFIIGIARGVSIIMADGLISDTILYQTSLVTDGIPKGIFANVMFFVYALLSFFIPSSSGMAVLTMPIFAPLADGVSIGREVIVDTYQYGMGVFYIINPTSLILASLAVTKISFEKWLKFIIPLLGIITVITMCALSLSAYI